MRAVDFLLAGDAQGQFLKSLTAAATLILINRHRSSSLRVILLYQNASVA